jgi:CheY-like chemotaxis protein
MIVDDDAAIRESLADLLRLSGFEVDQAEHGKAALERICADGQPSLVLLDMMMPVMNGWQFLELVQARSEPALVDLPVVAVTALGRQADDLIGRFG